jgi:putative hydrolases of HD superfamily
VSRRHERPLLAGTDGLSDGREPVVNALDFILSVDTLKEVRRRNPLVSGHRRERTAEHCWHVALAAICLHRYAAEDVDLGRAVQLAVIHDLPEAVVGDTFVYGGLVDGRRQREEDGMRMLVGKLAEPDAEEVMRVWREYEYEATAEGRFVMAIDVLLPIFINYAAGRDSSWCKHRIVADEVRKRVGRVESAMPNVAAMALDLIDDAVRRGLLR